MPTVNRSTDSEARQLDRADFPRLPEIIRYYDDFSDTYQTIRKPAESDTWVIVYDGRRRKLRFGKHPEPLSSLTKLWVAHQLVALAPRTVESRFSCIYRLS